MTCQIRIGSQTQTVIGMCIIRLVLLIFMSFWIYSLSPCDDQIGSENELDSEHFGSKRSVSVRGKKLAPHRNVRGNLVLYFIYNKTLTNQSVIDTPSFEEQPKGIIQPSNRPTGFGRGQGMVNSEAKCHIGRHRQSSSSFGSSDSDQSDGRLMTRCQQRSSSQQQSKSPLSPAGIDILYKHHLLSLHTAI